MPSAYSFAKLCIIDSISSEAHWVQGTVMGALMDNLWERKTRQQLLACRCSCSLLNTCYTSKRMFFIRNMPIFWRFVENGQEKLGIPAKILKPLKYLVRFHFINIWKIFVWTNIIKDEEQKWRYSTRSWNIFCNFSMNTVHHIIIRTICAQWLYFVPFFASRRN